MTFTPAATRASIPWALATRTAVGRHEPDAADAGRFVVDDLGHCAPLVGAAGRRRIREVDGVARQVSGSHRVRDAASRRGIDGVGDDPDRHACPRRAERTGLGTVDDVVTLRESRAHVNAQERGADRLGLSERGRLGDRLGRQVALDQPLRGAPAHGGDAHAERAQIAGGGIDVAVHVDVGQRLALRRERHALAPRGDRRLGRRAGAEPARRDVLQMTVDLAQVGVALRRRRGATPAHVLHELGERRARGRRRTGRGGCAAHGQQQHGRRPQRLRQPPPHENSAAYPLSAGCPPRCA